MHVLFSLGPFQSDSLVPKGWEAVTLLPAGIAGINV